MELGEGPPEGVEIGLPPQDSNAGSPVASLEQPEQPVTENLVSAPTAVDSDEYSNFLLFGESRFFYSKYAHVLKRGKLVRLNGLATQGREKIMRICSWRSRLMAQGRCFVPCTGRPPIGMRMSKCAFYSRAKQYSLSYCPTPLAPDIFHQPLGLKSGVWRRIAPRAVYFEFKKSVLKVCWSFVRMVMVSLYCTLILLSTHESMIVAALELTIAPLVSATIDQATAVDVLKGSKHSATDSIGFITVKLCRLPHDSPNLLEPLVDRMIADEVDEGGQIDNDRHLNLLAG